MPVDRIACAFLSAFFGLMYSCFKEESSEGGSDCPESAIDVLADVA